MHYAAKRRLPLSRIVDTDRHHACRVPEHLFHAWTADTVTPPIRWRSGRNGTTVVCPRYSERDLERAA